MSGLASVFEGRDEDGGRFGAGDGRRREVWGCIGCTKLSG